MSHYADLEIKSNSKFLKIEAGHPKQLRLLGDSVATTMHFAGNKYQECLGPVCVHCEEGIAPSVRHKANVFDHEIQRVMIFDFTPGVAKQIRQVAQSLAADKTDITDVDLKISVSGAGIDKRYMVMPWMPPKPLPPGLILHDLTTKGSTPF